MKNDNLKSSKYKYLIYLIIPIAFAIFFVPTKKIILSCEMNTDNLFLNFYDEEDGRVLYTAHNIQRVGINGIKSDQNYGNNNYIVMDWMISNYTINFNIFGNLLSIYNYTQHDTYKDTYYDDVMMQAYGEFQTSGSDVYENELIKRGIKISFVRETLELTVSTYPIDKFGLALNTEYDCKIAENII